MLSKLNIAETIEIPYATVIPSTSQTFDLQDGIPYRFSHVLTTITAGVGIVLPSLIIRDENANQILAITIIPFQFAGTTVSTTTMQTPEVPLTPFFGPAIAGFIPNDFYIFNGWEIQFADFLATPGVTLDSIITLTRSWQKSD